MFLLTCYSIFLTYNTYAILPDVCGYLTTNPWWTSCSIFNTVTIRASTLLGRISTVSWRRFARIWAFSHENINEVRLSEKVGVKVRALCRTLEIFHDNFGNHGARFVTMELFSYTIVCIWLCGNIFGRNCIEVWWSSVQTFGHSVYFDTCCMSGLYPAFALHGRRLDLIPDYRDWKLKRQFETTWFS